MSHNPQLPILSQIPGPTAGKKNPVHVLTLTSFYPTEDDDAQGCFVAESVGAMTQQGILVDVIAVQPFYRKKSRAPQSAVPVRWSRYFSFPSGLGLPTAGAFAFAAIVSRVRELHRSQPIELIHAHGPLPCGHAAMLLSSELKIPYVVSVHGLDAYSTEQVRGRAGSWCRRISQRVYQSSARVICISERVREKVLEGTGDRCRSSVVYNGVDPRLFSPSDQASDSLVILSVGNLIPIKGHEVLLRAIASSVLEFQNLTAEIIGDGPSRSRLQALAAELQISERVLFPGRQTRSQVAAAMRRCTVFALPSRYEGLGCVYLEAMATGKPAIGCREQGIAEVIHHGSNGLLVGPENERELAIALGMLLRDSTLRQNLGSAARETILDRFTLTEQAERLARIYRECVS